MPLMKCFILLISLAISAVAIESVAQDKSQSIDQAIAKQRESLTALQDYIGTWRGVGQLQRGSNEGAWQETSEWIWKFNESSVSLNFESTDAKYAEKGTLSATDEEGVFELLMTKGETTSKYIGSLENNRLVLIRESTDEVEPSAESSPERITFRFAAGGKRLVALYERQASETSYYRIAEVGYTREGSEFGKGSHHAECIVTGGKATIPVTHNGETYYVCCSGCKEAFDEDPEGILEEYRKRLAENDK